MPKKNIFLKNKNYIFIFIVLLLVGVISLNYSFGKISPEIAIHSLSPLGEKFGKVVAASCGFTIHGSSDEFSSCTITCSDGTSVSGTSQCGGACNASCPTVTTPTTPTTPTTSTPDPHPLYGQPCFDTNACGQTAASTYDFNGNCPAAAPASPSCSVTNVCGETFSGYVCSGSCNAGGANMNDSCIRNLLPSTSQVAPNGSVEFSWQVNNSFATPKCGFVDLTSATPRPIPGLQNLDTSVDRVRITNIQATTRFCLVCQFYSLTNPTQLLGEAVRHQWVRVQRIGEN